MTEGYERNYLDREIEVDILEATRVKQQKNPVMPVRLTAEDSFCFSCRRENSCWNRCCHGADITLTPYDILRLCKRLDMRPAEFLLEHTFPALWDKADLPVAKLKMADDGKGACPFMRDEGCSVYEDRPATCRYYPLGLASVKMKGAETKEDFFFLVKEEHCQGHVQTKELSVKAFREEQGVPHYDEVNRGWIDILMKLASWKVVGGPFGQDLTPQTKKMFFMVSTDVDSFRRFVFGTKFLETYEIDAETVEVLKTDDEALIVLGFDWMKNVIFNDPTINLKKEILQGAIVKARQDMGAC
jgi:Fe-S-cluster containining protein